MTLILLLTCQQFLAEHPQFFQLSMKHFFLSGRRTRRRGKQRTQTLLLSLIRRRQLITGWDCSAVVNYEGHYLPSSGGNGSLHFISLSNWVIVLPGCTETVNEYQCKWKRRRLACWSNCVVLNCVYHRCHCVRFRYNPPTNWTHNQESVIKEELHCSVFTGSRPLKSNRNIGSSILSGPGPPSVQLLPWQPVLSFFSSSVALRCANTQPKIFWRGQNKEIEWWSLPLLNKHVGRNGFFLSCFPQKHRKKHRPARVHVFFPLWHRLSWQPSRDAGKYLLYPVVVVATPPRLWPFTVLCISCRQSKRTREWGCRGGGQEEGGEKKTEKKESQGDSSSAISSECLWKRRRLVVARRSARSPPVPQWRSPFVRTLPTSPWASHSALIGVINKGEMRLSDEKKEVGRKKIQQQ